MCLVLFNAESPLKNQEHDENEESDDTEGDEEYDQVKTKSKIDPHPEEIKQDIEII